MKVAVLGSRTVKIDNIDIFLPRDTTEIVSGGAKGVDQCAKEYAQQHGIRLIEFLPQYSRYGRAAPLKRNDEIADYADMAIAFWDGSSRGTAYTIKAFHKRGKMVKTILCGAEEAPSILL